jgi:DNA-binding Lrp family transcriptional regulator
MRVYVLVKTKPGTSEETIISLKEKLSKNITSADSVFGSFDVILVIEVKDLEEFGDMLYQVIEKNPNTIHTETCVILPPGE